VTAAGDRRDSLPDPSRLLTKSGFAGAVSSRDFQCSPFFEVPAMPPFFHVPIFS
jgi:hypothetical protein